MKNLRNIDIKKRNKVKELFTKIGSKAEDALFDLISKLPEKLIPGLVMNWAERYLDKRMAELQYEQVKSNWNIVDLEKAVEELNNKKK